jgi:hypothetical protein
VAIGTPTVGTPPDEQTAASSSSAPPFPAVVIAKDLLLGFGVSGASSTSTFTFTGTGFSQDAQISNTGSTLAPNVMGSHKIATGSETGTLSWPHGSVVTSMCIVDVPGADPANPFDPNVNSGAPTPLDVSTATSAITIPTVTVTTPGSLLLYVISGNSTTNSATPPTGWTELVDRNTGLTGNRNWQVAYKANVAAGATGTASAAPGWTGSQRATGLLYVIQPALRSPIAIHNRPAIVRATTF